MTKNPVFNFYNIVEIKCLRTVDVVKKFSSGFYGVKDAESVGFQQDRATIWSKSRVCF